MSAPAFAWALERGCALGLPPSDRLVLIYLADMANGAKVCWPGQPLIARFTGLALRTVIAALKRLEARQLIRAEPSPGRVTRYHILRADTPANGGVVTPANGAPVTSANSAVAAPATPANGAGVPLQNVSHHPCKLEAEPLHDLPKPPPNGAVDPFRPKIDPKTRTSVREEGKVLSFPEKAVGSPQPAPPADEFNAWLDGLPPKRSQPLVVGQEVVRGEPVGEDDNPPVDPGVVLAELESLRRSMRMKAYPPRAATLSPDEQVEALCPHRPRAYHLPDATLRAARAELAARAAARGVVT